MKKSFDNYINDKIHQEITLIGKTDRDNNKIDDLLNKDHIKYEWYYKNKMFIILVVEDTFEDDIYFLKQELNKNNIRYDIKYD